MHHAHFPSCFHFGGISKPSIFKAEERLQVFDLGGVLGHLPGPWGRSLRLVRRGGWQAADHLRGKQIQTHRCSDYVPEQNAACKL